MSREAIIRRKCGANTAQEPSVLLGFLVHGVLIAVGTELFQLHAPGGIPAILLGGVAGHTGGPLTDVGPALGAFQSDGNADVFTLSHSEGTPFLLLWTTANHRDHHRYSASAKILKLRTPKVIQRLGLGFRQAGY